MDANRNMEQNGDLTGAGATPLYSSDNVDSRLFDKER
jgi:hypothetical protein